LRIDVPQPRTIKSTNKVGSLAIREKDFSDSDLPSGEAYQNTFEMIYPFDKLCLTNAEIPITIESDIDNKAMINNGFDFRIPLVLRDDKDHDRNNSSSIKKQPGNLDFEKLKLNHN